MERNHGDREEIRIMVLQDHPILVRGMELLLQERCGYTVCWKGWDAVEARNSIDVLTPDLLIMDLLLREVDGLDYIKEIHSCWGDLPILVYSFCCETLYAEPALRAGARGYLMQNAPKEMLISSVDRSLRGEIVLSTRMRERIIGHTLGGRRGLRASPIQGLTARELAVFRLLGDGWGKYRIAQQLEMSVNTVEAHRGNIMAKLNLKKTTELVLYALQWAERN